jgi:LPS sulfotransferase NodH/2-polyprenyl-3-methyl-5-hydroxy-6-metoxy-1,4-benzoquinol methylase
MRTVVTSIEPSAGADVQVSPNTDQEPVRFVVDERLDFNHFRPLRKSYIVASSYRSGSTYLCWHLWQTGLLGAPSEILNPTSELPGLMNRLKPASPADYIAQLVARRTSRNGIFGIKAHFHHFAAFLKEYPALLETLSPVTYINISREDKIAQAVSMARAFQLNWWSSRLDTGPKHALRYNREMIAKCLEDVEQQDLAWRRWFEAHDVTPFEVTYDDLIANAAGVVDSVLEYLGVQNDEPEAVTVPRVEKQSDETNKEWIERFRREMRTRGANRGADSAAGGDDRATDHPGQIVPEASHFFERYDRLVKRIPTGAISATGFVDVIRLRHLYDAIVARNRVMFQNARVLDIMSSNGFWSLAALDAGAAKVVGVEVSPALVDAAKKTFEEYAVRPGTYQFVNSEILAALETFDAGIFDLVLCQGTFEHFDSREFFHQLARLGPKHVILDTGVDRGEGPIVRFTLGMGYVLGTPSHQLIMFLCDAFDFRWRLLDWRTLGITDWTGIHEYERDQRRVYILERIA